MAYTDITSQLLNNQYTTVNGVAYVSKSNSYESSYGFATSAYNGTTWFASQNLNVHSSAASIKFDISPMDSVKGVNVSFSYIIDSEKNWDIGFFGKSGATLATGTTTTGSSEVYAHTYGQNGATTVRDVTYFIQSPSSIQIIYKKDGTTNSGLDRLFFTIAVELGSGTGGGTDPSTTYYWLVGTRILPVGRRKTGDGTYTLPSTALTSFTANLNATSSDFPTGFTMNVITSGNYRILWASGGSTSNIWQQTMGTNPYTTDLPYILGGVFGHADQNVQVYSSKIYTGTTAQLYNPTSVFGSINNTATFFQCSYHVVVESDKNSLRKAYFDVNFGSPFNETWKTGKSGYARLISSATNSSVSITVSRTGSGSKSGSLTRPGDGSTLTLSPTSNSDKICTVADLATFDSSAAAAISTTNALCVKYNSSIHDTGYSGTDKLMRIHEFLYFTGTPSYFKDDSQGGGSTPTPTGYGVEANVLSMNWTNAGPSALYLQALTIYAGDGGTDDDVLYSLLQPRTLAAGGSGSFTVPVVNDYVENVTYLTVSVTCSNYASISISFNTQSQGSFYVDLQPGSGSATQQVAVTSNITITGGSLNCSYASG
jgi:hypothetical protein